MDLLWKCALFMTAVSAVISVHLKQKNHDDGRTRCHGMSYAPWHFTPGTHWPVIPNAQTPITSGAHSPITSGQNILGNIFGILGSFHGWGGWSSWGKCSSTCGVGYQTRQRHCHTHHHHHHHHNTCPPGGTTYQVCWTPCRGGWSPWSSSPCSKSCGGGVATKYRTCTNPIPLFGGQGCRGKSVQIVSCNTHSCAVNGAWSSWQSPSHCTVSCGGGVRIRTRTCNNPKPSNGGHTCQGVSVHTETCNTQPCSTNPSTTHSTTISPSTANPTRTKPVIMTNPTTAKPTTTMKSTTTTKRPSTTSRKPHYVTIKLSGKVGK